MVQAEGGVAPFPGQWGSRCFQDLRGIPVLTGTVSSPGRVALTFPPCLHEDVSFCLPRCPPGHPPDTLGRWQRVAERGQGSGPRRSVSHPPQNDPSLRFSVPPPPESFSHLHPVNTFYFVQPPLRCWPTSGPPGPADPRTPVPASLCATYDEICPCPLCPLRLPRPLPPSPCSFLSLPLPFCSHGSPPWPGLGSKGFT